MPGGNASVRRSDLVRGLSPVPAALEPALVEPALELYVKAAEVAAKEKNDRLREMSEVAIAHGAALLSLGRKEEAMARWQAALDEMPTSPMYQEIEERLEKALGIHSRWKALDALKGCDRTVESAWGAAGRTKVVAGYDTAVLAGRMKGIYEELIKENHAHRHPPRRRRRRACPRCSRRYAPAIARRPPSRR